jgi:TRAP-type C4-dicarboxylate transport system permease small subunit
MLRLLIKTLDLIHIILVNFAKLLIVGMVLIVFANVVLRFGFNSGITWSEEVALLFSVWFVFISFGLGVKQRLHITINLLPKDRMPAWLNRALEILAEVVVITVGVVMVKYGTILTQFTMRSVMPATNWPSGVLYMVLPFAGVSIIIEALLHIFKLDKEDKALDDYLSGEGKFKDVFGGPNA